MSPRKPLAFALLFLQALALGAQTAAPDASPSATPAKAADPDWASGVIWYQLFPERFRNGDPANDPTRDSLDQPPKPGPDWKISRWTADWYSRDAWEVAMGNDFYKDGVFERRYGGDLQGVLDKLDYLADLGITAIYFNPMFYARSLHKYDGSSYHHIDPYFGPDPQRDLAVIAKETADVSTWTWTSADKMFLDLVKKAHERGMKVILDGVFNHTGRDFFAFKDLRKNQETSPYKDWYVVYSFDNPESKRNNFTYKGWWGHASLPVFAASADGSDMAPGPKAYVFAATKRWMDPDGNGDPTNGIDGWRLDVAPERPAKFWAEWNALVRKLNPNAYTSAEDWKDSTKLINDGGFSACMNYFAFAIPVKAFLIDKSISAGKFAKTMDERREELKKKTAYEMMNLMDSHDTDRLASMIVNAGAEPGKMVYSENNHIAESKTYKIRKPDDTERAVQRMVVLFQMTYVGSPMVYYGDEAGMWGADDPDDRMPMAWQDMKFDPQKTDPRGKEREADDVNFEPAVYDYYKSAIALRKANPVLSHGDYKMLATNDGAHAIAFERRDDSSALVVVLNRSEKEQTIDIDLPAEDAGKFEKPKTLFSTTPGGAGALKFLKIGASLKVTIPPITGGVIGPS